MREIKIFNKSEEVRGVIGKFKDRSWWNLIAGSSFAHNHQRGSFFCPWSILKRYICSVESGILLSEDIFWFSEDLMNCWKFCFETGKTALEIYVLLKISGQMFLSGSRWPWISHRQPPASTSKTNKNIVKIHDLLHSDFFYLQLGKWLINWI